MSWMEATSLLQMDGWEEIHLRQVSCASIQEGGRRPPVDPAFNPISILLPKQDKAEHESAQGNLILRSLKQMYEQLFLFIDLFFFHCFQFNFFFSLLKVGDIWNEKQFCWSNNKEFTFKKMQERNTSTSEKISKTNFIKPRRISWTPLYWNSALFFFFSKELSHNWASNSKEKLKTAYFPTTAKCPNF